MVQACVHAIVLSAAFLGAASLTGCTLEKLNPDLPALPAAFQNAAAPAAERVDPPPFAAFGSPELDRLIAAADDHSPDLAAAIARVRQADARARQAGAAILPEVDADLAATRFGGGSHGMTAHETDWSALLVASYEVDFWGKNRAARDSAHASAMSSRADLRTARITILTSVAGTYFQIQSLRERIALARLNLKTATDVLQFVESRYGAGALGPADLAGQRAAVAGTTLIIPQLQQQEVEALGALAVLVGQPPEGFTVETLPLDRMTEPAIAAGLPASLLQRRPDLVAAEYNLQAAHADLAAARAALFPSLSLSAGGGVANPAVQAAVITLAGAGYSLTAGADLVPTVFDNGRRRAVTREAAAREEELLANYRGAIFSALADVEKSLAEIDHLNAQKAAQLAYVAASERAFEGAQLRYREGSAEYVAVLESQRILYAAREQYGEYELARLQALLGLNKALGGGWDTVEASR
jgi:NodT family efflux transporter outer membrane factor (OMF) lipoprotein